MIAFSFNYNDYKTLYLLPFGGPAGELSAAFQYFNQRYTMPDDRGKALLTDIGTEEIVLFSYRLYSKKNI